MGSNVVLQRIWVIGKTVNWFWVCILQKLFEILKSTTENQQNLSVFFFKCFKMSYFVLKYFPQTLQVYSLLMIVHVKKEVSDNVHRGKLPDSANGSSQNNAGSSLIRCQALGVVQDQHILHSLSSS